MRKFYLLCLLLLCMVTAQAQNRALNGRVVDASNSQPLIGVSVSVKGTQAGTATDINGKFTLNVPSGQAVTLVAKYIGYADQEVAYTPTDQDITIKLPARANDLDEVVVVGYGTIKRRDLTGSVASVKASDIVKTPTHNALEAIEGRASGVDITRSSGNAGSGVNIQIRGTRSIPSYTLNPNNPNAANYPLYVIDGVQTLNASTINNLNPNDIESIDVLQDAASTAIYGSQGANGVVIVTTKKGISGKPKISYNGYYGFNGFTQFPQPRQGEDYLNLRREAYRGTTGSYQPDNVVFNNPGELAAIQAGQFVNWVDLATRNGQQQSHTVSVRGGSDATKAFFSAGYFNEQGQLRNNDYTRYTLRYNIDHKLSSWFKAGITGQLAYSKTNDRRDPLSTALTATPLGVPYNADGSINLYPIAGNTIFTSPLTDERPGASINELLSTEINTTAYTELTPIKGLTYRMNFGSILSNSRRGEFYDQYSLTQNNAKYPLARVTNSNSRYYNWDNIITYNRQFAKHNATVTVLSSYVHSDGEDVLAQGISQTLNAQNFYGLAGTQTTSRTIADPYSRYDLLAYAGRFNYSYDGRYLLQGTLRFDGASRLAPGHKWDSFPSVSAGWVASQESFLKNVSTITNLKFRASYGVTGNSGLPVYGTQSLLTAIPMGFGDTPANAYTFNGTIVAEGLGWEKSHELDLGIDFGVLKNRITGTVDFYNTKTTGLLYPRSLPQSTGQSLVYQNIASTSNQGINITLTSINIQSKSFTWSTTATFSHNREKILSLVDGRNIIDASVPEERSLFIGSPVQSFYTYKKAGIWQLNENPSAVMLGNTPFKYGDIKVQDLNGDNIIDATNDRTVIGHAQPQWYGGLQNTFRYKNIDLNIYVLARYGQTIKAEFVGRYNPSGTTNGPANFNYWTPENPTNDFPQPRTGSSLATIYPTTYPSLYYIDGSFIKIKNLSLGYTFPKSITDKFKIGTLRAYATASNIFTFTRNKLLRDYDPERGGAESAPISRQLVFGVNLDL
ncbi:TonB-dependent receptor [Mucilaginibacter robiniae]|uniref:TonB-dependent receptor n=1 Tax=Mucilaginibacter robiniae TaxID=2728022 RepID=A0A7L5E1E3_9SPHI|nr:TonB-dependent receptor [Mucilaginibacter robiniae]QJD94643.1 TonB-dependent receptor [Mucilaginibacter robiniae]